MKPKLLLPIFVALGTSASANAAAIIYESFSQTAGALNGQAAGTGLSGNWTDVNNVNVVTPTTLSYGTLAHTGGQADMLTGAGTDAYVTTTSALGDAGLLDDGSSLWFSFMFYKTGDGGGTNEKGGFAFGSDRIDGAFNGTNMLNTGNGLGCTIISKSLNAAAWSGGGNVSGGTGTSFNLSTSYLVVGRMDWGATGTDDDTITLYLANTGDLSLGAAIGTKTIVGGVDQTAFNTISMSVRGAGTANVDTVTYDEIRFGATSADVLPIPEPSAAFLGGLGCLLLLRRRK